MTKLKQEYMFNHDGKNWIILDDFIALKEKLKKTQKEYAKARNQLNEANEVIKWYDGLENILIDWKMLTGQPKGTANKYLERWGVK